MLIPELLQQLLVALAIGSLIGVERERLPKRKFFGTRTSAIISLGGPISIKIAGILNSILPVVIYLALGAGLSLYLIRIRMKLASDELGLTTSATIFILTLTSVLVGYSLYFSAVAIAIITALLLAGKRKMRSYVNKLSDEEIINALKVGAVAFIIYPLLPSEPLTSLGLIVPQKVLLFILLVLGVRFAAFVVSRQVSGTGGLPLTGLFGGGVSSLATVSALSETVEEKNLKPIAVGIILSTVAMVLRNIFIASVSLSAILNQLLLPGVLIVAAGVIPSLIIFSRSQSGEESEKVGEVLESPLSFKPALKLGVYFLLITIAGNFLKNSFGQGGLWTLAFFGGLVSSAAVTVSVLSMLSSGTISVHTGALMVIIACISSILIKIVMVRTAGNKDLLKKTVPIFVSMMVAGIVPLLLLY